MMKFLSFLVSFWTAITFAQNKDVTTNLKPGDVAPQLQLQDSNGKVYNLADYKGKVPVVIYFYPKASTPGCTAQACGIRDSWSRFSEKNIPVLGISVDGKEDIKKFVENYHLNFPLLSDSSKEISKKYGVLKDKGYDQRITFIVDKEGKIEKIIDVKDIDKHADEVYNEAVKLL